MILSDCINSSKTLQNKPPPPPHQFKVTSLPFSKVQWRFGREQKNLYGKIQVNETPHVFQTFWITILSSLQYAYSHVQVKGCSLLGQQLWLFFFPSVDTCFLKSLKQSESDSQSPMPLTFLHSILKELRTYERVAKNSLKKCCMQDCQRNKEHPVKSEYHVNDE